MKKVLILMLGFVANLSAMQDCLVECTKKYPKGTQVRKECINKCSKTFNHEMSPITQRIYLNLD